MPILIFYVDRKSKMRHKELTDGNKAGRKAKEKKMLKATWAAMQETSRELETLNAQNLGEGSWKISPEMGVVYIPSYREHLLEKIAQEAEEEVFLRQFGQPLYGDGTQYSLVRNTEYGEDYFRPEEPGTELDRDEVRRHGPYSSLIELFDAIIDVDMQEAE